MARSGSFLVILSAAAALIAGLAHWRSPGSPEAQRPVVHHNQNADELSAEDWSELAHLESTIDQGTRSRHEPIPPRRTSHGPVASRAHSTDADSDDGHADLFALTGIVVDEEGHPIADADLVMRASTQFETLAMARTKSGDDGSFSLEANTLLPQLAFGYREALRIQLGVSKAGYRPHEQSLPADKSKIASATAVVALRSLAGRTVTARLVGRRGEGVQGLRVKFHVLSEGTQALRGSHYTDGLGVMQIRDLPANGVLFGRADHHEHGVWKFRRSLTPDAIAVDLGDLRAKATGVLAGDLRGPDGVPHAYTLIGALPEGDEEEQLLTTRTDEVGRFRFASLDASRTYQLGRVGGSLGGEPFQPSQEGIQLQSKLFSRVVEVVGEGGRLEPIARIHVDGPAVEHGGFPLFDGRFVIQTGAAGRYEITATAARNGAIWFGRHRVNIGADSEVVRLTMESGRGVALTVRAFGPQGEELSDFSVALAHVDGSELPTLASRMTESKVQLDAIPGRYVATISPGPGHASFHSFSSEILVPMASEWEVNVHADGERSGELTIELEGWGPQDNVYAIVSEESASLNGEPFISQRFGGPRLAVRKLLPPGSYTLSIARLGAFRTQDESYETASKSRRIEIGAQEPLTVHLGESEWR
ncbi:MAG: carboxypeptidase-like regulatory domain-containing protein [Planctomycetota bacterium]